MTAPHRPKPLLVRLLVADCTTMSAPWQMGRNSAGVATVESQISGRPWLWARSATARMSKNPCCGLLGSSPYKKRVLRSIFDAHWSRSVASRTQRHSMFCSRMKRTENC